MSGIVSFDALFPSKAAPVAADRLFAWDSENDVSRAVTIQSILDLIASEAVDWADIAGKPASFTPAAHTLGSHSNVAPGVDAAADGTFLKKIAGVFTSVAVDFYGITNPPPPDATIDDALRLITAARIAQWDAAYGWGNHAGQYRPVAWVPAWGDVTGKPSTFAPSGHTLGSHSDAAALASATEGQLVRKAAIGFDTFTPTYYSPTNPPPVDASVPDFLRTLSIGDVATWNAKVLEFSTFADGTIPLIVNGAVVDSEIITTLSVNPWDVEDPEYLEWVPEVEQYRFPVPVAGPPATNEDEYITLSQLPTVQTYGRISGGVIQWSGSGLTYNFSRAILAINGECIAESGQVTLDAADPTDPRFDGLGWEKISEGIADRIKITGTPLPSPPFPQFNPETQVEGIFVSVPALATTPPGVTTEVLYTENAPEWVVTFAGTGTGNAASTADPKTGIYAVELTTHQSGFKVRLDKGSVFDLTTLTDATIGWDQKLKAALSSKQNFDIIFLDGSGNPASNLLQVNLAKSNLAYQFIGINLNDFTWTTKLIRYVEIRYRQPGTGAFLGTFFDNIKLQGGVTQPVNPGGVKTATGDGIDNTDPSNPVWTFPTPAEIGANVALSTDINAALNASLVDSPGALNRFVSVSLLNSYAYVQEAPINGSPHYRKDGAWVAFNPFAVAGTATDGHVVTSVLGVPTWQAPSGGGGSLWTDQTSYISRDSKVVIGSATQSGGTVQTLEIKFRRATALATQPEIQIFDNEGNVLLTWSNNAATKYPIFTQAGMSIGHPTTGGGFDKFYYRSLYGSAIQGDMFQFVNGDNLVVLAATNAGVIRFGQANFSLGTALTNLGIRQRANTNGNAANQLLIEDNLGVSNFQVDNIGRTINRGSMRVNGGFSAGGIAPPSFGASIKCTNDGADVLLLYTQGDIIGLRYKAGTGLLLTGVNDTITPVFETRNNSLVSKFKILANGRIFATGLPTTSPGAGTNELWNDSGSLKIA